MLSGRTRDPGIAISDSPVRLKLVISDAADIQIRLLLPMTPRSTAIFAATDYLATRIYKVASPMQLYIPCDYLSLDLMTNRMRKICGRLYPRYGGL